MHTLSLVTRPVDAADEPFLRGLYVSARRDELAPLGWPDDAIEAFGNQQFEAQRRHYAQRYPDADHRVITVDDTDVGQVMVDRSNGQHTLVDISLLPGERGRGIGTSIVRELVDDADRRAATIHLSVLNHNPAKRLYARLGFDITYSDEIRTTMHRAPIGKDTT
jgi:ribosomal protein S18 acetylase RimI-like enzyme